MTLNPHNSKSLAFRVLFIFSLLISVFIIFGIAELFVRLLWGDEINVQYTSVGLYKDQVYSASTDGWLPNAKGSSCGKPVSINSLGLRGTEVDIDSDKEKELLLGDSVLFGVALTEKETISEIFKKKLNACILNTSVIGYGTHHYVDVLKYWIQKAHIDRALLFFCLNDVQNYESTIRRSKLSNFSDFVLTQFRSRSKLYMAVKNMISDRSKVYFLNDEKYYHSENASFNKAIEDLDKLKSICDDADIKLHIILLPYEFQLRNHKQIDIWRPQNLLTDFCEKREIEYLKIDFSDLNRKDIKKLYLYADGIHFSPKGSQHIAEEVIKKWWD